MILFDLLVLVASVLLALVHPAQAEGFLCAGQVPSAPGPLVGRGATTPWLGTMAAKPLPSTTSGTRYALVLFARFGGEAATAVPGWGNRIFDPSQPGSLSHFYDTMSFGALQVRGEAGPRVYASTQRVASYLADDSTRVGQFGRFSLEVLTQADDDIDFSRFDNDGPDGVPDSGDDDGVVDAVFIVIATAPANFLVAAATGVAGLGFAEDISGTAALVQGRELITRDRSSSGQPIRISTDLGTIQQGRTLTEAVGSMCHEYGHLLGLPDLYNVEYLRQAGASPADDGAGVGAWCLMGWGAPGWEGGDGPNSLGAWSRARLGWAQVIEPHEAQTELELHEVGQHGQVYRIPLSRREYYLLEYRRRASTWYDRHLPAEGVLIWHVERTLADGDQAPRTRVDLECADGRWQDAGYPVGQQPDPLEGGTNLDFWAHDTAYARTHAGNLGDATDPFDGVRFRTFTPETNPAAVSHDGQRRVRLTDLRLDGDLARVTVALEPPRVELTSLVVGDSLVAAGKVVSVAFSVANRGGTRVTGMRARLVTEDPLVEILDPEIALQDLGVGQSSMGAMLSPSGLPRFRFRADLKEIRRAVVGLELYDAEGTLLDWGEVSIIGVPAHRVSGVVRDPDGQPLADIRVTGQGVGFLDEGTAALVEVNETVRTDSSGQYEFHLPRGSYSIDATPAESSPWWPQSRAGVTAGSDTTVDLTLARAYRLHGYIRDPERQPVPRLPVKAMTANGVASLYAQTGGDGSYSLKLPAGNYSLWTYPVSGVAPFPAQQVGQLQLQTDQVLDLQVQRGVRLEVRALGSQGEAVQGLNLLVSSAMGLIYSDQYLTTGRDGQAQTSVMPGVFAVSVIATPAPYLPAVAFPIEVSSDTTVQLLLTRGVRVAGHLLEESGHELPGGTAVSLAFVPVDSGSGGNGNTCVLTAESGFAIGLAPGRYRARMDIYYWPLLTPAPPSQDLGVVEVRADTTLDLVARPGIAVQGRVVNQAGPGLDLVGATLSFKPAWGQSGVVPVQADGSYATSISPGEYQVYLYPRSMVPGALPQQLLGTFTAAQDTTVDWVARSGALLQGRIEDAAGQGISDLMMEVHARNEASYIGFTTHPDGSFALALFPGPYRLLSRQGLYSAVIRWNLGELEVPAVGPIERRLPGGAVLRVQVRDLAGRPVRAYLALLQRPDELHDLDLGAALATAYLGADGQAEISLAPGRYALAAYGSDPAGNLLSLGRVLTDLEVAGATAIAVTLPAPTTTVHLDGQVRDGRDGRVAQPVLQFWDKQQEIAARVPCPGGQYQVDLPPGVYSLTAALPLQAGSVELFTYGPLLVDADRTWDIVLGADGTAVADQNGSLPVAFALQSNYPNPFNGQTLIRYQLPQRAKVELVLYNLAGQVIRRLVHEERKAGAHQVAWDGRDEQGRMVASGVYLCLLTAGDQKQVRRMALVR